MTHPTAADYNEAMQNLRSLTGDDELRLGEVACNGMGLPMTYAGSFADVYQVHCARRTVAVKCFKTAAPGLRQRYREISQHLKRSRLPFMVDFDYVEQGLRVNGTWQPLLKMQWVEGGLGLNEFVSRYLDRPNTLRQLLALWVKLSARLRQAAVAHADLQHGNVLLVPVAGSDQLSLKLIDYDGMHVPGLAGEPSGELGHPSYQHPQRLRDETYSGEVDRFSHLLIYCAVSSLLSGGRPLWERFNNQENLLFKEADFAEPAESELFQELWALRDPRVRALVGHLLLATQQPLDRVPLLEEIVDCGLVDPLTKRQEQQAAALLVVRRRPARSVAAEAASTAAGLPTSAGIGEPSETPSQMESVSRSSSGTLPAWMRSDEATRPAPTDPPGERYGHRSAQGPVPSENNFAAAVAEALGLFEPAGERAVHRSVLGLMPRAESKAEGQGRDPAALGTPVQRPDEIRSPLARGEKWPQTSVLFVLAVVVPLVLLAVGLHIAARQDTSQGPLLSGTQSVLALEGEAELARNAWFAAWDALDRDLLAEEASALLAPADEKAALAETMAQLEDFGDAAVLYQEALELLHEAPGALIRRRFNLAQDAWSAAWAAADRDLLARVAAGRLGSVEEKVARAGSLAQLEHFCEAAVLYREALRTLHEAQAVVTRQQLGSAHDAWSAAWSAADRDLLARYAATPLGAAQEKAGLAETLAQSEDFGDAALLYGEALALLHEAQAILIRRELKLAQDAWSAAWAAADRDLLARIAAGPLTSAEEKAALAGTLVQSEDFGEAAVLYGEANELLRNAGAQATASQRKITDVQAAWNITWAADRDLLASFAASSLEAIEAKVTLAKTLVREKNFAEALLVYGEALDLLSEERDKILLAVAPFDAPQAAQYQQAWANHLGTAVVVRNSIGMKLRLIPPGQFIMGSPVAENGGRDERPQHWVRITAPFFLGMYEVTQGEYQRVMDRDPSYFSRMGRGSGDVSVQDTSRFPVEQVSWNEATEFCRRLSALSGERSAGRLYRLPTEAEWEYACRAGTTTPFHGGSVLGRNRANCLAARYLGRSTRVGSYASNAFGLYDMHGNVSEWCSDWYDSDYYSGLPVQNPQGPSAGWSRVLRGGGWDDAPAKCRAAFRDHFEPSKRDNSTGFRVACEWRR